MSKWVIESETLGDIADAIRTKKGTSSEIQVSDLASEIASIDGGSVFKLSMTFNNETPASADGTIYLEAPSTDYDGNYDIMWGDSNGVMANYSKIGTINIAVADEKPMGFIKLMPFNAIPKYATKICAVQSNTVVTDYDIPTSKLWSSGNYGNHLYSFGLLADVHVQYTTGHDDVEVAMTYLNERESVDATCVCGDLTSNGTVANLEEWKTDRDTWSADTPVYACNGNHEAKNSSSIMYAGSDTIRKYLDSDYTESTGTPYFSKTINGDVFAFVAIYEGTSAGLSNTMFSTACLDWLENLLETNRNQRVFIFAHVHPYSSVTKYSGFASGNETYPTNIWGGVSPLADRTRFLDMLAHYKNAIWFSGHTHIKYEYQKIWEYLNVYETANRSRLVHISSLVAPRDIIDGSISDYVYAESEGAVVDVYANCIRIRNRNFVGEKFYGYCEYLIDTTPITIPSASKTVISISATKTTTNYYTDETLSTADITVTATYSDETTADVSADSVFDTQYVDLSTAGTYSIGVSYTYEGDTVTTSVQVTSQERPATYTVALDATFSGELSAKGTYVAPTSNNNYTLVNGNHVYVTKTSMASLTGKPLYYRLLSTTGIDSTNKVGLLCGVGSGYTNNDGGKVTDYSLESTSWTPLVDTNGNQMQTDSTNHVLHADFKASGSSTASFPVSVNVQIQIGYVG